MPVWCCLYVYKRLKSEFTNVLEVYQFNKHFSDIVIHPNRGDGQKQPVLDNNKGHAVKTCPGTGFFLGNSTSDAKNNFYPLVRKKMQEILTTM